MGNCMSVVGSMIVVNRVIVMNGMIVVVIRVNVDRMSIDHKPQRLIFTNTQTSQKQFLDTHEFINHLSTGLLPVYERPHLGCDVTLVEDIVGHIRKPL